MYRQFFTIFKQKQCGGAGLGLNDSVFQMNYQTRVITGPINRARCSTKLIHPGITIDLLLQRPNEGMIGNENELSRGIINISRFTDSLYEGRVILCN